MNVVLNFSTIYRSDKYNSMALIGEICWFINLDCEDVVFSLLHELSSTSGDMSSIHWCIKLFVRGTFSISHFLSCVNIHLLLFSCWNYEFLTGLPFLAIKFCTWNISFWSLFTKCPFKKERGGGSVTFWESNGCIKQLKFLFVECVIFSRVCA